MNPGSVYTRAELFKCLLKFDLSNLGAIGGLTQFSHFNVDTWHVVLWGGEGATRDIDKQELLNTFIWTFKSTEATDIWGWGDMNSDKNNLSF